MNAAAGHAEPSTLPGSTRTRSLLRREHTRQERQYRGGESLPGLVRVPTGKLVEGVRDPDASQFTGKGRGTERHVGDRILPARFEREIQAEAITLSRLYQAAADSNDRARATRIVALLEQYAPRS